MNYAFPMITNIQDVLPAIKDHPEFIVAEKDGYTIVNYVVVTPNTFSDDGTEESIINAQIRRECRGIAFDENGDIMSRPPHKFFNLNEKAETEVSNLCFDDSLSVFLKADGSMVRPIFTKGVIRLGTKMGITDTSNQAEEWMISQENSEDYYAFFEEADKSGITPTMEWVSPNNRIVVDYEEPALILLLLRTKIGGEYIELDDPSVSDLIAKWPGKIIEKFDKHSDYHDLMKTVSDRDNIEGIIGRYPNGHMFKSKTEWYLNLHRVVFIADKPRHIVKAAFEGEIDDIIPALSDADKERVEKILLNFWADYESKFHIIMNTIDDAVEKAVKLGAYDDDGNVDKAVIAKFVVKDIPNDIKRFIFAYFDGKDVLEIFRNHAKAQLNQNVKFDKYVEWLKN